MKKNTKRLRALVKKHELTKQDVATICHMSLAGAKKWLANPDDPNNFRDIGDAHLELLELKLGEKRLTKFKRK